MPVRRARVGGMVMDYSNLQGRLTWVLGELSDIIELVLGAQRDAISTHRTRMAHDLEVVGDQLGTAHDWITRARLNLMSAGQADGGAQ